MHSLLIALATTPAPTPSPSLRPGLSEDQVTPGLLGFLLTAFIVVLTALLIVDMVRRIRRVRYRAQVEDERAAAEEAAEEQRTLTPQTRPTAQRSRPVALRSPPTAGFPSGSQRRCGTRKPLTAARNPLSRASNALGGGTLCVPPPARRQPGALAALR